MVDAGRETPKIACVFPGQGSQYLGMGKELYSSSKLVRDIYDEAHDVLKFNLLAEKDKDRFHHTRFVQPALLTLSYASFRLYKEIFPTKPSYLAGHSLGEITALLCAESVSFKNALKLVVVRSKLMSQNCKIPSAMTAVYGISHDQLNEICSNCSNPSEFVGAGLFNSKEQVVISGALNAIIRAEKTLEHTGYRFIRINAALPFHTSLMGEAKKEFHDFLLDLEFKPPNVDVFSNVSCEAFDSENIRNLLSDQLIMPVRWLDTMQKMQDLGVEVLIELGPGNTLAKFANGFKFSAVSCENPFKSKEEIAKAVLAEEKNSLSLPEYFSKVMATLPNAENNAHELILRAHELIRKDFDTHSHWTLDTRKAISSAICAKRAVPSKKAEITRSIDQFFSKKEKMDRDKITVFCLPFAGGQGQLFAEWENLFNNIGYCNIKVVPLDYPGRGLKLDQPFISNLSMLTEHLYNEIVGKIDGPFAVFGHSMGGILAYEIAKEIESTLPTASHARWLFLSATSIPAESKQILDLAKLNDQELRSAIEAMGGVPREVLESPDFDSFFMPILRNDFSVISDYRPKEGCLKTKTLALYGSEDSWADMHAVALWRNYASQFESHEIKGDHFFISSPLEAMKCVASKLYEKRCNGYK